MAIQEVRGSPNSRPAHEMRGANMHKSIFWKAWNDLLAAVALKEVGKALAAVCQHMLAPIMGNIGDRR